MDSLPWFQFADFLDAASEFRAVSSHALDFSQGAQSRSRRPSSSKGLAVGSLDDTAAKDLSQQPVMGVVVQTNANQVHDNRYNMISLITSMESSISNRDGRQDMSKVLSLLPETTQDNVSATLQSPDMQLLKLLMYLLSNNNDKSYMMNGVRGALDRDETILKLVKARKGLLYRHLRSHSGPTSEALSEKIFQSALRAQDVDVIRTVLSSGIDPNEQGIMDEATPLQFISRTWNVKIASILIKAGANVNSCLPSGLRHSSKSVPGALRYAALGGGTLRYAALGKGSEMVDFLLSEGAHANTADGTSALCTSVEKGDIRSVQLLISAGADVKNRHDGYTALHMAYRSSEMVNILLRAGADVNAVTDMGTPSLAIAVMDGNTDVVQSLLAGGLKIFGDAICFAADCDDMELVRILLDAGADIDGCSEYTKRTGLTAAVEKNNASLVKFLLDSGANVEGNPSYIEVTWEEREDCADLHGSHWNNYTPLQAAAFHGRIEVAGILLEAGADINACSIRHSKRLALNGTAVQIAAHQGNMELVRLLWIAGANVNAPAYRRGGRTALQAAVENGNREVIDFLLAAGADINAAAAEEYGRTALAAAIMRQDVSLFSSLLEAGAIISDPSARRSGVTALAAATANRDIELVRYSLFAGADPVDSAALLAAVKNEDVELIRILLTARAECNMHEDESYGYTALYAAVANAHHEIVELLLETGINLHDSPPDIMGGYLDYIPLHRIRHPWGMALTSGDIRMVRTFLAAGADPTYVSDYASHPYNSCLVLAISFGEHVSVIQTLLEAGANVNAPVSWDYGRTALQKAVEVGNEDVVDILLEAGADANAPPAAHGGVTALQAAAIGGFLRIARVLLENGADVNAAAAEEHGRTALAGAAEHGRIDMLQFLLDNGAVIEGPGRDQYESAINRAAGNGHKAVCNLLRSHHRRLYGSP